MNKGTIAFLAVTLAGTIAIPRAIADSTPSPQVISEVVSGLAQAKTSLAVLQQVEIRKLLATQSIIQILGNLRNELIATDSLTGGQEKDLRIASLTAQVTIAVNAVSALNAIDAKEREVIAGLVAEVETLANRLR